MESKWRETYQARYARLAPSAPLAHRTIMRSPRAARRSTSRTSALSQHRSADDAACGRAGASGAAAAFLSMRVCRRSAASHARLFAPSRGGAAASGFGRSTSGGAASGRTGASGASQRVLRPQLRCCRIRLHCQWPATTPRPRAIPPNGRHGGLQN
jgi:hypothetical protein